LSAIDIQLLQVWQLYHGIRDLLSGEPVAVSYIENCDRRRKAAVMTEETGPVIGIGEKVVPVANRDDSFLPKIETIW